MIHLKNIIPFALFLFVCAPIAHGQESDAYLDGIVDNAKILAQNGDPYRADSMISGVVKARPTYGKAWDVLSDVCYREYYSVKDLNQSLSISVNTSDSDGGGNSSSTAEKQANDTLVNKVKELFSKLNLSARAKSKFIYVLRRATLNCPDAWESAIRIRKLFVDVDVDSAVKQEPMKYFDEAEQEFAKSNYNKAALLYKRAIQLDPSFYKAHMYLGDCYYATANYSEAAIAFKEVRDRYPFLLEPHKYLADTYYKLNLLEKSVDECIAAMYCYPDASMVAKLTDALGFTGKRLDITWTRRLAFPNTTDTSTTEDLNIYKEADDTAAPGPWKYYKEAGKKILPYCNPDGLITRTNNLTHSKYMEVYCWEEMLRNSQDSTLAEARRMQQAGYLDCYVLVTCFHIDFYPQYQAFATANKDRIDEYFHKFIKKS